MIWKDLIEYIKNTKGYIKNTKEHFWDEDKEIAIVELIFLSMVTPFLLLLDICGMPFELLYLLLYRILWGGKKVYQRETRANENQ